MGWTIGVLGNFSLYHRVQNGFGAHPVSYQMGTGGCYLGGKTAAAWSWPLTFNYYGGPRMREAVPPLRNTPSWRGGQLKNSTGTTLSYLTFIYNVSAVFVLKCNTEYIIRSFIMSLLSSYLGSKQVNRSKNLWSPMSRTFCGTDLTAGNYTSEVRAAAILLSMYVVIKIRILCGSIT